MYVKMPWEDAYQYYSDRKEEAYSRLRGNPMFQRFRDIVEWRQEQTA